MVFLFRMFFFFFFNDTATTEIYTLSLHDALPISTVLGDPAPPRGVLSLLINALAFISHARSHVGAANNPWHSATRSTYSTSSLRTPTAASTSRCGSAWLVIRQRPRSTC